MVVNNKFGAFLPFFDIFARPIEGNKKILPSCRTHNWFDIDEPFRFWIKTVLKIL
jgi:hypothetical protein